MGGKSEKKSKEFSEDMGVGVVGHSRTNHCKTGEVLSSEFNEDQGGAYYDHSRYDHATYGGTTNFEEILKIIFPETKGSPATETQTRDAMHVATHKKYDRDYFVTKDKAILRKHDELKEKFGITVFNPKDCVKELQRKGIQL